MYKKHLTGKNGIKTHMNLLDTMNVQLFGRHVRKRDRERERERAREGESERETAAEQRKLE